MTIKFNPFFRDELTIHEIQRSMENAVITSKELVMYYLHQIAKYDQAGPRLNSILEINPDALFIAESLDYERKATGARGPLHGIPIFLKDNIETDDFLHTSAGTMALSSHLAKEDAFLVQRLRDAGAVILGKSNMTELSNGMATEMWAGYSSRGGQVVNPYGPEWFVGGSSSGSAVAVAANFTVGSIGTETDASILSPAIQNSVVGIKPTVGLISRRGIIPFTYSQDTAGPIARTVTDAALLLEVLAGVDQLDPATHKYSYISPQNYSSYLDRNGLKGARIGIFTDASKEFYKSDEYDDHLFQQVIRTLKGEGATIVGDVDIPSFHREWSWEVTLYELKHSLDNYLSKLSPQLPVHSVSELIEYNKSNAEEGTLKYGQDKLEQRAKISDTLRNPNYINARLEDLYFSQEQGIDYALKQNHLDVILFPSYVGSTLCAKAGYPSIAVPAGYKKDGRPFGITFAGAAFSEATLIKLAYAFEQATTFRKPPKLRG
ncbi:amidase family protein [Alkalihalobacterium chitinilyticum]|uniref:Amidase family protein n=1 Tax=Alkalihalobacterium chitinilyticum TaxID=2980103 RepID=A0ABT5VI35_9BACI|nr:amidase family protein [Alkalihalobacterium chitinilyticum]MDE5415118.1 amidase family protein [Alkalihalobacterium chitinilyticum]